MKIPKFPIGLAALLLLLEITQCFAGHASFDNGKFVANWTYDQQTDSVTLQLEVATLGWVGFGFAEVAPNDMKDYDVFVAGVKTGQGYINVSKVPGISQLIKDKRWRLTGTLTTISVICHGCLLESLLRYSGPSCFPSYPLSGFISPRRSFGGAPRFSAFRFVSRRFAQGKLGND